MEPEGGELEEDDPALNSSFREYCTRRQETPEDMARLYGGVQVENR